MTVDIASTGTREHAIPRDVSVVGLICTGHFASHFTQLMLPPLFPALQAQLGVSYAALGGLLTAYFAASGICQALCGVLSDRLGAHRVLIAGLTLLSLGTLGLALAPSYGWMLPAAVLAGIGNSVFHPADFSILSHRVRLEWRGRAFASHALAGTFGYAAAPVTMLALVHFVSIATALTIVAAVIACIALLLYFKRETIAFVSHQHAPADTPHHTVGAILRNPAVLSGFAIFLIMALPGIGFSSFFQLVVPRTHEVTVVLAALSVTLYMVANAFGTLTGGWVADRTRHHERVFAFCMAAVASLVLVIAVSHFPGGMIIGLALIAGFISGIAGPSRDVLVRSVATDRNTGTVFGFTYSGYDLGASLVPLAYGAILDSGDPHTILYLMVVGATLAACFALSARYFARRRTGGA